VFAKSISSWLDFLPVGCRLEHSQATTSLLNASLESLLAAGFQWLGHGSGSGLISGGCTLGEVLGVVQLVWRGQVGQEEYSFDRSTVQTVGAGCAILGVGRSCGQGRAQSRSIRTSDVLAEALDNAKRRPCLSSRHGFGPLLSLPTSSVGAAPALQ
jgi:hypothetical protein